MLRKKRVLLLSEGFGSGHTRAAHALSVALRRLSPTLSTRVIELGPFLHPTIAPLIFTAYRKTISSTPKLYGKLYRNQYKKSLNRFAQLALHRLFYAQTAEIIRQLQPDAIVCTHPFPSIIVSRLKRAGLDVPLCTVITDYDAHGTWISSEVNMYYVSSIDVRRKLMEHGIGEERIQVTGIPIHPNFWRSHNRDEVRDSLGLRQIPTVMIMGGGWGMMNTEEMYRYIATWRDQIQFLFCLGSNNKTKVRMAEDPLFNHPNIRLLGYTNEIDKLMDASDLLITKPGGMTCTEAMAKGLPMLFYDAIPGQEEENCQFFIHHGLGERITTTETIERAFAQLLDRRPEVPRRRPGEAGRFAYDPAGCPQAIVRLLG
jgi:processive 1,2-diacylglycerol beta-glucosyltransferase